MRADRIHILLAAAALILAGSRGIRAQIVPNLGGQRAGISAFQFLKLGVGARGVAMGESFVAVANDASALYWNPAGLVQFEENQAFASHTDYVVDISHEYFGAVYHLSPQDAVGAAVTSLHMAKMEITTELQPYGTGRFFSFGDVGVGVTYARRMTDQFSFGTTVRYVEETLDVLKMRSVMVDIGTYYWTGLNTIRFAVVISNFGADVKPTSPEQPVYTFGGSSSVPSFQSYSLPTVFRFGVAFEPLQTEQQQLTASIQLNHPNDNSEHVRIGLEYGWEKTLYLRCGVKRTIGQQLFGADATSDEAFSVGAGFAGSLGFSNVSADYSYTSFTLLGTVHRFSLSFSY